MHKSRDLLTLLLLTTLPQAALAELQYNLAPPATTIAQQIYDLHSLILLICLGIFIVVFGFMFYALIKHRKSLGHQPAAFQQNLKLEIAWTIIPFLILIGMAYPTTRTIFAMKDISDSDMSIKITGHQWNWEYEYLGQGLRFTSNLATPRPQIDNQQAKGQHYLLEVDQPLVIPAGKKIKLLMTAGDVIHSWWIPSFGVKQDAIPGFIKEAWIRVDKPGTYRGQCAELCGIGHGFMPIVVEVKPAAQFSAWLDQQKASKASAAAATDKTYTLDELKPMGEKVFMNHCAVCHQATGMGIAGVFPPLVDGAEFKATPEQTAPLAKHGFWKDGKIVLGPKQQHLDIVVHGIDGTAMQAFGSKLSAVEIAAVITYERNSWGNHTGDVIQPAEVAALNP